MAGLSCQLSILVSPTNRFQYEVQILWITKLVSRRGHTGNLFHKYLITPCHAQNLVISQMHYARVDSPFSRNFLSQKIVWFVTCYQIAIRIVKAEVLLP